MKKSIWEKQWFREIGLLLAVMVPVYFLWHGPIIYPLKILTVFFHEASHALAMVITGGQVDQFNLNPDQSGSVWGRGGNQFIVSTAGYIGSCLFGSVIYLAAARTKYDRWILGGLGLFILVLPFYFSGNEYSRIFGGVAGITILLLSKFAPAALCDFLLRLIGMTSMFYAILDIRYDVLVRTDRKSDAVILSEVFGGSPVFWGITWIIISIIVVILTVRFSLKRNKKAA